MNSYTLTDIHFFLIIVFRMVLACILGGIIGYERENTHRPAGFRTHILVCVGSALVMVTSEYISHAFRGLGNTDPARLGAQVISGIGFLGAGTIIREGFAVKGLTTAASLWAVSCVGIAAGIGFYQGAVVATILIFCTLIGLKRLEEHFTRKNNYEVLYIETVDIPGQLGLIGTVLGSYGAVIKNIEFIRSDDKTHTILKLKVKLPEGISLKLLEADLAKIEGVMKVT